MDIVPSAWAMPSLRKSHTVSAKSLPKTTIRNSKIERIPVAAGRNGTYSDMAELPFCADFHPSQSRRTGEILLLRRQRGRIGRCARVGEPRRGWQRVKGGHFHTQARQTGRSGALPPSHRQVRAVIRGRFAIPFAYLESDTPGTSESSIIGAQNTTYQNQTHSHRP